jgi:hypothetical protein
VIRRFPARFSALSSGSLWELTSIPAPGVADSDDAGRAFRFESGHHSDLKAAGVGSPSGS